MSIASFLTTIPAEILFTLFAANTCRIETVAEAILMPLVLILSGLFCVALLFEGVLALREGCH